jgi:SAM-dependent methyltransferase
MFAFGRPDLELNVLGRQLAAYDGGLGLFRLAHLLQALGGLPIPVRRVISIGSGSGLHERVLARLFPAASVIGLDLRAPSPAVEPRNLTFHTGDLLDPAFLRGVSPADFVFSIECIEHIEQDSAVMTSVARLVRPGGVLYVQVPFATTRDLVDRSVVEREWQVHGHVRPGYTARDLYGHCVNNGLRVLKIGGAFWSPVQPIVWSSVQRLGSRVMPLWSVLFALAQRDVREGIPTSREEATGIKVIATRGRAA